MQHQPNIERVTHGLLNSVLHTLPVGRHNYGRLRPTLL